MFLLKSVISTHYYKKRIWKRPVLNKKVVTLHTKSNERLKNPLGKRIGKHLNYSLLYMNEKKLMTRAADNIRILAASMVEKANSGHPGGAMGGADFINVLFSEFLVYDPDQPEWFGRDRFFLDPGHMSPMLYSALAMQGKFSIEELKQFRQWGSPTPGHPEREVARGIENRPARSGTYIRCRSSRCGEIP